MASTHHPCPMALPPLTQTPAPRVLVDRWMDGSVHTGDLQRVPDGVGAGGALLRHHAPGEEGLCAVVWCPLGLGVGGGGVDYHPSEGRLGWKEPAPFPPRPMHSTARMTPVGGGIADWPDLHAAW
jgi:hypothetical protein